jgi:hypothetical protein
MHPVYREWFSLLKAQPNQDFMLVATLYSDKKTKRLVDELRRGPMTNDFANIVERLRSNPPRLTLDKLLALIPNPNVTKEEAQERLDMILDVAKRPKDKLENLLDQAQQLHSMIHSPKFYTTPAQESQLMELIEKIKQQGGNDRKKFRKYPRLRTKFDYFQRVIVPQKNFEITFNNLPSDLAEFDKKVQEIAEIVINTEKIGNEDRITYLGKVESNKLITNFPTRDDFLSFMTKNPKIKQQFAEALSEYVPNYGTAKQATTKKKKRKQANAERLERLVARGITYNSVKIDSYGDVQKYLKALQSVPYVVKEFIPSTFEVGKVDGVKTTTFIPPSFFLTRNSVKEVSGRGQKSLILNPFAKILLENTYVDPNTWFKDFFSTVRRTGIISSSQAELLLIDDLYNMIKNGQESQFGFDLELMGELKEMNLGEVESGRERLREIIFTDETLNSMLQNKKTAIQENTLSDMSTFTYEEAKSIKAGWTDEMANMIGDIEIFRVGGEDAPTSKKYLGTDGRIENDSQEVGISQLEEELEDNGFDLPKLSKLRAFMESAKNYGENKFIQFILSLDNLSELLDKDISSAHSLDKFSPENSIIYLSQASERMLGDNRDLIRSSLEEVNVEENFAIKKQKLEELNMKMPKFLTDLKKAVFQSFSAELEDFSTNYLKVAGKTKDKAIRAIDAFKRQGLLTGGE